ncbi:MAG: class I SAM-dependent methyltransferase [Bacteroidetes bacterium]|jgi:hypothetical protein|nr:class I SAM-dependent methyltransferase [Bacteroidota bacterium]
MLTKTEKALFRASLFQHLDGIVTAPVAHCLLKHDVLTFMLTHKKADLSELAREFKANPGYLNVGLRVLASQGWLDYEVDNASGEVTYHINAKSEIAFKHAAIYEDIVELQKFSGKFHRRKFERAPFQKLESIFKKYTNNYGLVFSEKEEEIQRQVLKHIEGMLVGPTVVALGMSGMFHKYFMEASFKPEEFHADTESFEKLLDFFTHLGWFNKQKGTFSFTEKGLFFAKRASAYGVTVSYIPTFRQIDDLIFGNPKVLWNVPEGSPEKHVDREMNVWGSGGAHSTYFKKIDEIIISIFNRPIDEQPKGIVDMGCGNGAFLQHIFEVIEGRTLRGEMLSDYPLFLVGADYNQAALKVTRANLINADIWAKVIWGDIGRPDILATDLKENYGIELEDLLNVRTFLDHNRIWEQSKEKTENRVSSSSGGFAFRGAYIPNNDVEDNLLGHFKKWAPYVHKFGLLVIELHTIPPAVTSQNIGKTAATAYDATHGFSDQYIVEVDIFNKIAAEAGLFPDERYFTKFPNSELATVSINLLKGE